MPVTIKRPQDSESGRCAVGMVAYALADATALMRLLLRWRHHKFRPLLIPYNYTLVKAASLRQYLYNARTYIRENPRTFPQDIQDLANAFTMRIKAEGLWIVLPPKLQLRLSDTWAQAYARMKGGDYTARQLFVQWISAPHDQGEYIDIPCKFSIEDKEFCDQMAKEYASIIHVETSVDNIRVIWHAESTKDKDESPW